MSTPTTNNSSTSKHTALERLSWGRCILNCAADDAMEVVIDKRDYHYDLYRDCVLYLRAEYPPESFTCSLPNDIGDRGLGQLPPSFGTLVNLLADRYLFTPQKFKEGFPAITLDDSSILDFILRGMLSSAGPLKTQSHAACALRASSERTTEADLYQALFLDCITDFWTHESFLRANAAVWSPMPWSHQSVYELSQTRTQREPYQFIAPVINDADLAKEDDSDVWSARWRFGSPMDIPWFNASHDGHPFCPTLSSYTDIRRSRTPHSLHADAALWVGALTLGVLEAVTRTHIPSSVFLVPGQRAGERALSGTRLLRFMVNWHHHMHCHYPNWRHQSTHQADAASLLAHGQEAARLLHRALNALDEEVRTASSIFARAGRGSEIAEMVCAITLALHPLCGIVWCCWKNLPETNTLATAADDHGRRFVNMTLTFSANAMQRAGWCPNVISASFLSTIGNLAIVSNLLRMPPYIRETPHEHADCTQSACVFYTISDNNKYAPRHVTPECRCENIKPSLGEVIRLLSEGRIPVVTYDGAQLLVDHAQVETYIAVSHVWADGMGSVTEDGLPACVVKRVANLAQTLLPESGAFWIDSLCVPQEKASRKRAILLMAQTYGDASKVLVIDACIRAQCSLSLSVQENLLRIAMSGWVRRVWTLQEGLLARELHFEFVDGPVDVAQKFGLGPALSEDLQLHSLCRSMVPVLSFRAVRGTNADVERKTPLADIIRMLRLRSTSRPEDEIVAISSLLPLDLGALLAITGEDMAQRRMKEFFLQLREVSNEFPMYPNAPRLTLPGFTWAPRTLAQELAAANPMSDTSICTEDGLLGEYFVASIVEPISAPAEESGSEGGTPRDAEFHLVYRPSHSVYSLRLFTAAGHAQSGPIDALLFLDDKLSKSQLTKCAAVRRGSTEREMGESGASFKSPAQHFQYVASGILDYMPGTPDLFWMFELGWFERLCKTNVRLT